MRPTPTPFASSARSLRRIAGEPALPRRRASLFALLAFLAAACGGSSANDTTSASSSGAGGATGSTTNASGSTSSSASTTTGAGGAEASPYPGLDVDISPIATGHFDTQHASSPIVVPRGEGRYRMFYYGRRPAPEDDPTLPLISARVGIADSTDLVTWTKKDGPLTGGAVFEPLYGNTTVFDAKMITVASVLKHGAELWMYYSGIEGQPNVPAMPGTVKFYAGLATSTDEGLTWKRVPGDGYKGAILAPGTGATDEDTFGVIQPHVIEDAAETNPDLRFKMYYHTLRLSDFVFSIFLATSPDGVHFQKRGKILAEGKAGAWDARGLDNGTVVRLKEGGYRMFYEGLAGSPPEYSIGMAVSADGLTWTKQADPVLHHGPVASWDEEAVGTPMPTLLPSGEIYLHYVGVRLGSATGPATEQSAPHCIGLARSKHVCGGGASSAPGKDYDQAGCVWDYGTFEKIPGLKTLVPFPEPKL